MEMTDDAEADGRGEEVLGCGHTLCEVWESWDEGRAATDPHHSACPYCGAALDRLRLLDDYVRSARAAGTGQEPPADGEPSGESGETFGDAEAVTTRVMDIVRLETRPGRPLPVAGPGREEGDAWIAEAAAAKSFRAAAEAAGGVLAGSCRIAPLAAEEAAGPARPAGALPRGPLRVSLEVAADLTRPVPEIAEAVRGRVVTAAAGVGLDVRAVDVAVVDLLPAPDPAAPDGAVPPPGAAAPADDTAV
jgi:hypothetical protein